MDMLMVLLRDGAHLEEFTSFNGWLYKIFPQKEDRAFTKLSEYAGNAQWLFPYRLACDYMHCNSFSAFESIGEVNGQFPMGHLQMD